MNEIEEKIISLKDGTEICTGVINNQSKEWLIVVHGIGEHYRRHLFLADVLGKSFNYLFFDLRNHGKSSGVKGKVRDFGLFISDLYEVLDYLREKYQVKDFSLYGHSLGGLVVSSFLTNPKTKSYYPKKVYLSSPPVGVAGIVGKIAKILPRKLTSFVNLKGPEVKLYGLMNQNSLSHDPKIKADYNEDPLNYSYGYLNLLIGLVHYSNVTYSKPLRLKCPLIVSIGTEDKIVDPNECIDYFTLVEKAAKLKVFKGAYHEIHNEIRKYQKPYFEFLKTSLLG